MKAEDIREWEDSEIEARIGELQEERFRLRFRSATMQLENPRILRTIKRDIARMKTILHERELERERSAAQGAAAGETAAEAEES